MNPANPRWEKKLSKDYARVAMSVITNPNDWILPAATIVSLAGNINTVLDAKSPHAYANGEIESVLSSVSQKKSSKDNFFVIHPDVTTTGGIRTHEHDNDGRELQEFELLSGWRKRNVNEILPGDGSVPGARVVHKKIHENDLITVPLDIQIEPAHDNNVCEAEAFGATSATIFVSAGNEGQVSNTYDPVCLYVKVCNLTKLLQEFDFHPVAADLQDRYRDVTNGENHLGYFLANSSTLGEIRLPYIAQKCVAIEKNGNGGKNYFFQFYRTNFSIRKGHLWFQLIISRKLSQKNSTNTCCVAFLAFLEYHGIAPVHGLECAIHTRFLQEGANDWNQNIGLFRVTQSGIAYSDKVRLDKISREYNYSLQHRHYPYSEQKLEVQLSEDQLLDVRFANKLDQLHQAFRKMSREDKIGMMDDIVGMHADLNDDVNDDMLEEITE